jgi:predicted flap endonuclease-1-like 5' DNA nuclease
MDTKIPQEAQNMLMDRKQEKERQASLAADKAENEAPRKAVGDAYDKLRDMIGVGSKKEPVKKAKGGSVGSASKRADGCAVRGKTKGMMR